MQRPLRAPDQDLGISKAAQEFARGGDCATIPSAATSAATTEQSPIAGKARSAAAKKKHDKPASNNSTGDGKGINRTHGNGVASSQEGKRGPGRGSLTGMVDVRGGAGESTGDGGPKHARDARNGRANTGRGGRGGGARGRGRGQMGGREGAGRGKGGGGGGGATGGGKTCAAKPEDLGVFSRLKLKHPTADG